MNKIINIYYKEFESFGVFWKLKNPFFTFSIIALVFFFIGVLSLFGFIDISKKHQISKDSIFNFLLFSEVCALLAFKGMEEQRNNHIKKKYREIYRKELTLHEIKRKWFENTIDLPFYEYANLAEKIEKFYLIEEKYSKPSLSRHKIMEYIFAIDSKNRVLAMFMGIVALFAGLNIANGANIEIVYAILDSLKFWDIFFVVLIISLTIFLSAYMFRFILVMLMSFWDFLFDNSSDMSKISKRKKQIFIAELGLVEN